jgi:4-hydroxybenzoate polyprenyltransferase
VFVGAESPSPPLCVALGGTLVRTELVPESLLQLLKRNPLYLFRALWWRAQGKAVLKAEIAARVKIDPARLRYDEQLLAWLRGEHAAGRELWLCTAANERFAHAIGQHLGIFTGVIASDSRVDLAGERKAQALVERFGRGEFDYCGNEWRDLAVWRRAHGAIMVNASAALERRVGAELRVLHRFPRSSSGVRPTVRALRPHQWAKNVLLLVPLLAAHRIADLAALGSVLLSVVAFSLCASSMYVFNDLLDLEADREHPRKSLRPFARGEIPVAAGVALTATLLAAAALISLALPTPFRLALAGYCALALAYTIELKRFPLLDALALAALYTLRIVAGAAAATVVLSFWLLLFSVFLFLSLAFVKRYAELEALRRQQQLKALGRGYRVEDLAVLWSFGTASGYLSVLVLALYINSPEIQALYHRPKAVWILCVLLLYWISRVWMTAHRGGMHDDPVVYALRDRVSLGVGVLAAITVIVAI